MLILHAILLVVVVAVVLLPALHLHDLKKVARNKQDREQDR